MARNVKILAFFTVFTLTTLAGASKLNVATILLPLFDDFPTNFTLQSTDNGCFRWSTSTDNVISLNPVDPEPDTECSSKVVVSTTTKDKRRTVTDVLAEDVNTRQLLRCVVIVDTIESLSITTTTRELILEEAPEVFEVRAFDNQGNEFSTLAGVPFDWFITPLGPNKDVPVIRFIAFKDSTYQTPSTLLDLEEKEARGHKVLLEGVKTGIAKVSVRLAQREYTNVKSNDIQLMIIANLMIMPREIYVMEGDVFCFKILHTSYGQSERIDLKQSQYYLEVEEKSIATTSKYSAEVHAVREGETKISLLDRNIDNTETGVHPPFATIYVVKPAYMVLTLLPHNNWAALVSEEHSIVAEVYSNDDHKIVLGPDVSVQSNVGEGFYVQERTRNGTWTFGWTQQEGIAEVTAILDRVSKNRIDPPLTAKNEITIYPRIILIPSEVILPWDPVIKPKYDLDIVATGGDGKFLWSSSNHSIGVVTQYGKVHTHSQGSFEVSAAMHRNHHNRQSAKVHILPPSRLEIVDFVMEAEVGTVIFLHVALYAEKDTEEGEPKAHIPFTRCQDLAFKVKTADPKFAYNKQLSTDPIGISCGNVGIFSQEVGTSKITVTYHTQSGKVLTDSVSVTYFKPLKLVQPEGPIVLGVGTSINLIYTGGPKTSNSHNKYLVSKDPDVLRATEVTDKHKMPTDQDYTVVKVVCTKLGKTEVVVTASNTPNIPNCKNQESSATVEVICGKPRKIEVYPELKVADAKSCPMDLSSDRVVVQSHKDFDLIVRVKDDEGRVFSNITSFQLAWGMDPKGLSQIKNLQSVFEKELLIGTAAYSSTAYQKFIAKIEAGQMTVTVGIVGYLKNVLSSNKVTAEWPEFLDEDEKGIELKPINATIKLYMVDDTIVTPNIISLYNHPSSKQLLSVKQGSGFYQIALSNDDIAHVKYNEKSRQLDIQPRNDGELTIKLIDLCLVSKPAVIVVNVVSVHILRVEMSDRVELSKCISCIVRLYDDSDNLLSVPNLDLVEIDSTFENDIARLERMERSSTEVKANPNTNELHYIVTGIELGDTKLIFSIGDPDSERYISSAPVDLQVFPPLKLYPRNVTVIVGSQMQYTSRGGPQPIPNLEYSMINGDIAKISSNGIIMGSSVGQTNVKARALGTNPTTGQKIVYAEDQVDVRVIKLTNIKVAAPLSRFQVGATVPLWATGVPDHISPLILATVEPSIDFSWGVEDANIVKLSGILDSADIDRDPLDMLSVRLTGLSAGTTTVTLNATIIKKNKKATVYSSSVVIEIFDRLALIGDGLGESGNPVLIAPFSQYKLQTNMDDFGDMTYRLLGEVASSSTQVQRKAQSSPMTPVTVNTDGVLQSYGVVGTSLVLISFSDSRGLKQTLAVPVEVKPIHYMLLSFHSKWYIRPENALSFIPAGADFEMRATYYDNVGNLFHAGFVELQALTSRFDLVKIRKGSDNSSFHITTRLPGVTGVKVWSDNVEKTADYFKLHVGQSIEPIIDSITLGDVICFSTPVQRPNVEGEWSSTDASLMKVDKTHGIAVAVGQRPGQVSILNNLLPSSPIQLKMHPTSEIIIQAKKNPVTNVPNSVHKVYIVLRTADSKSLTNFFGDQKCKPLISQVEIPKLFTCGMAFADTNIGIPVDEVLSVTEKFDIDEGKHYCEITPVNDESGVKFSTICSDLLVTVQAGNVMSKETRVKFLPGVNIPEEIIVDSNTFETTLILTGLPEVLKKTEVTAIDTSIVCVTKRRMENSSLMFNVKLLDYHKNYEEMKHLVSVRVESPGTEQDVLVLVKAKDPSKLMKECPTESSLLSVIHTHQYIFATIVAIVSIFTISCFVYSSYIQPMLANSNAQMQNRSAVSCACSSGGSFNSSTLSNTSMDHQVSCYCTKSPEVRRNRRYM